MRVFFHGVHDALLAKARVPMVCVESERFGRGSRSGLFYSWICGRRSTSANLWPTRPTDSLYFGRFRSRRIVSTDTPRKAAASRCVTNRSPWISRENGDGGLAI